MASKYRLQPFGFLLVDKPPGITSAGVLNQLKSLLVRDPRFVHWWRGAPASEVRGLAGGWSPETNYQLDPPNPPVPPQGPRQAEQPDLRKKEVKLGHTGTLDQFASGLLVCPLGAATVLAGAFLEMNKTYDVEFEFGRQTDTLDPTGEITEVWSRERLESWRREKRLEEGRPESLAEVIEEKLAGWREQVPPDFSAKKIGGRRASDMARAGDAIQLKPKRVHIEFLSFHWDAENFRLRATIRGSSGTYIRAIGRDLGQYLGVPVLTRKLRRLALGPLVVPARSSDHPEEYRFQLYPGPELPQLFFPGIAFQKPEVERKALPALAAGKIPRWRDLQRKKSFQFEAPSEIRQIGERDSYVSLRDRNLVPLLLWSQNEELLACLGVKPLEWEKTLGRKEFFFQDDDPPPRWIRNLVARAES